MHSDLYNQSNSYRLLDRASEAGDVDGLIRYVAVNFMRIAKLMMINVINSKYLKPSPIRGNI